MNRESFGTRLGFLLVSAGCAIGIGNVWRFPYVVGKNGGGLFVFLYLIFLFVMGAPALMMELAVGRSGRASALKAYRNLEPKGSRWHIHGYFCVLGNYLLMMYYTTVAGWMLSYFFKFMSGQFNGTQTDSAAEVFEALLARPGEMVFWMSVTVIVGFLVLSLGLRNGLERISKFMMSALLILMLLLAVHSITLPGASEGLSFYLIPNLSRAMDVGIGTVITEAMNQAFFTLSIGIGSMAIFGSYMSKDYTLGGEALRICGLDTFVALCSGLIIFPACFSFGVEPGQGPSLIFVTLPNLFRNMSGGRVWGSLFFLFMTFASFSTVIAVFENILANCIDNLGWKRKKAVFVNLFIVLLASLPCVLGFNILSDFHPLPGMSVLDAEDFIVSNILLPGGSLIFLLFCVTRYGWGFSNFVHEANKGEGIRIPASKALQTYLKWVMPVMILIILIQGLI